MGINIPLSRRKSGHFGNWRRWAHSPQKAKPSLLPPAAERLHQQDGRRQPVRPRLRERNLVRQLRPLAVDHLQVAHEPRLVADRREPGRPACRRDGRLKGRGLTGEEPQVREAILDLLETDEDLLPVVGERLGVGRLGLLVAGPVGSAFKERERHRGAHRPFAAVPREQVVQVRAVKAPECREPDRGEERGLRDPDPRVGGREGALGLGDVRPPLQELAWEADRHGGHLGFKWFGDHGEALGVLAHEDRERVERARNRALRGELAAAHRLELGLRLEEVQVAVRPAAPERAHQFQGVGQEGDVFLEELPLGDQRAEIEVVLGNAGLEDKEHALVGCGLRLGRGAGAFQGAPQGAEEVDLVAQLEREVEGIGSVREPGGGELRLAVARVALAHGGRAKVEGGIELRALDAGRGNRLVKAREGRAERGARRGRLVLERIERGVMKHVPPAGLRELVPGLRLLPRAGLGIGLRGRGVRLPVVGPHGAARGQGEHGGAGAAQERVHPENHGFAAASAETGVTSSPS